MEAYDIEDRYYDVVKHYETAKRAIGIIKDKSISDSEKDLQLANLRRTMNDICDDFRADGIDKLSDFVKSFKSNIIKPVGSAVRAVAKTIRWVVRKIMSAVEFAAEKIMRASPTIQSILTYLKLGFVGALSSVFYAGYYALSFLTKPLKMLYDKFFNESVASDARACYMLEQTYPDDQMIMEEVSLTFNVEEDIDKIEKIIDDNQTTINGMIKARNKNSFNSNPTDWRAVMTKFSVKLLYSTVACFIMAFLSVKYKWGDEE